MKGSLRHRPAPSLARTAKGPARLVQIEKPVYGGEFLARDEGKTIFVPLVLPGEQVRVEIVEDRAKRGYAKAEMLELVNASPHRVAPPCPNFGPCGGCHYQHAAYKAQLRMKQQILRETLERGRVTPPDEIAVLAAEPWQYRNRIRVAFDAEGNPGYRGRRSQQVIPIRECSIAAPVLVETALAAADHYKRFAGRRPHELSLFCDATGDSVLASVIASAPADARLREDLDALLGEGGNVKGAELKEQRREQAHTIAQSGALSLNYRAGEFDYLVDHGAFFQVNRWLVDSLMVRVVGDSGGDLAWDLFAGVGLFARQLSAQFARVVAVESAPSAARSLAANLKGSAGESAPEPVLDFLRRNANGPKPDLIVMDPPRSGLGEEAISQLLRIAAPAMTYVSCDPATLARDLRELLQRGYAIESIALVDLFPQTYHLESVVHLRRA
jgi:23S rRNA (uracil1939-C5)-methyltransferase